MVRFVTRIGLAAALCVKLCYDSARLLASCSGIVIVIGVVGWYSSERCSTNVL